MWVGFGFEYFGGGPGSFSLLEFFSAGKGAGEDLGLHILVFWRSFIVSDLEFYLIWVWVLHILAFWRWAWII